MPLLNGSSGRYIPGYPPIIRPADVASKGDRLDFNRLVYLVPNAVEQDLVDRVCAVAQVCETPELRLLATELVPCQARKRGDS